MTTSNPFYQHLLDSFISYSTEELIELNNETVKNNAWGSNKAAFRTAIISAFSRKGLDLSYIISKNDGFTSIKLTQVRLEQNTLVPICINKKG